MAWNKRTVSGHSVYLRHTVVLPMEVWRGAMLVPFYFSLCLCRGHFCFHISPVIRFQVYCRGKKSNCALKELKAGHMVSFSSGSHKIKPLDFKD